ncbi:MAG: Ig-like domain-containing protein [Candidatus Wallbacteria bacterium]|nr:Ig-like domain-containing protein [Candidatus Wallbacteria bacterium]
MKQHLLLLLTTITIMSCSAAPAARTILSSGWNPQNADIALLSNGSIVAVFESSKAKTWKEIFCTVSSDNGSTWSNPFQLSTTETTDSRLPRVAAYKNQVHLVWQEKTGDILEVRYKRFTIGAGDTYEATVSAQDGMTSQNPDIAVYRGSADPGTVFIVWQDLADGNFEIYSSTFATNAAAAAPALFSTRDGVSSTNPSVTPDVDPATPGNFFVTWVDSQNGQPEVYYKSPPTGSITTDTMVSSNDSANSQAPTITASRSKLMFAWEDYRYFGLHDTDIFTRSYGIDGSPDDKTELIKNTYASKSPSITSDSDGNFHLVWQDIRSGNYEIYYAKNDTVGWSSSLALTTSSISSEHPVTIASPHTGDSGTGVYIVWQESSNLYFLYLPAGGASADTPTAVIYPENDETGISVSVLPSATYNKALDPTTVTTGTVKLFEDTSETPVAGTVALSSGDTKVVFHPSSKLKQGISYRFELSPSITDTSGNPGIGYITRFTTIASGVSSVTDGVKVSDVKMYRQGTSFAFQYNLNYGAADSVVGTAIKVYSTGGKLIKSINDPDTSGLSCTTIWDGQTRYGRRVANGVYLFTITVTTALSHKDEYKGRFLVAD